MRTSKRSAAFIVGLTVTMTACAEYLANLKADMAAADAAKDHMLQAANQSDGYDRVDVPRGNVMGDAFKGKKKWCGEVFDVALTPVGSPVPPDQQSVRVKLKAAQAVGKTRSGQTYVMANDHAVFAYGGVGADQFQSDAGQGNVMCMWTEGVVDATPGLDIINVSRWNSVHEQRNREEFHKEFMKGPGAASGTPATAGSASGSP